MADALSAIVTCNPLIARTFYGLSWASPYYGPYSRVVFRVFFKRSSPLFAGIPAREWRRKVLHFAALCKAGTCGRADGDIAAWHPSDDVFA